MSIFSWFGRGDEPEDPDEPHEPHLGGPREPIETKRLTLRPFREGDGNALYQLNSDPEVMRYFPNGAMSRKDSDAMLKTLVQRGQSGDVTFRAVTLKAGQFVGLAGLNRPRFPAPFMPCVEVGWRFVHAAWGKGFATEAASAAISFGFEELGLKEIVAFTVPANERSIRVMERLGMSRDPDGDFDHPRVPDGSPLKRHVLYRISREDWEPPQ